MTTPLSVPGRGLRPQPLCSVLSGRLVGITGWEPESESGAGTASPPRRRQSRLRQRARPSSSRHASLCLPGAGERFRGCRAMGWAPAAGAKPIQPIVPEQRPRHGTPTRVPRVQEAPRVWGSRYVTPAPRLLQVMGRGLGSRRDPQDRRTLGLEQRPRRAAEQELPSERGFLPGHGRLLAQGVILGRCAASALGQLPAPPLRRLAVLPGRGPGGSMAVTQGAHTPTARDG